MTWGVIFAGKTILSANLWPWNGLHGQFLGSIRLRKLLHLQSIVFIAEIIFLIGDPVKSGALFNWRLISCLPPDLPDRLFRWYFWLHDRFLSWHLKLSKVSFNFYPNPVREALTGNTCNLIPENLVCEKYVIWQSHWWYSCPGQQTLWRHDFKQVS